MVTTLGIGVQLQVGAQKDESVWVSRCAGWGAWVGVVVCVCGGGRQGGPGFRSLRQAPAFAPLPHSLGSSRGGPGAGCPSERAAGAHREEQPGHKGHGLLHVVAGSREVAGAVGARQRVVLQQLRAGAGQGGLS